MATQVPIPVDQQSEIRISPVTPITVEYAPRTLRMHIVAESELDAIASLSNSIHIGFVGASIGSLIAFGIVLATVQLTDPLLHATFVGLTWISGVFTVYFGVRAYLDYRASKEKLNQLKGKKPVH